MQKLSVINEGEGSVSFHVNGQKVGELSGRGEVWFTIIVNGRRESGGRFKYFKAKAKALRYAKWALTNFTPEQIFEGMKSNTSPLGWAEANGYDPLTKKERSELHEVYRKHGIPC